MFTFYECDKVSICLSCRHVVCHGHNHHIKLRPWPQRSLLRLLVKHLTFCSYNEVGVLLNSITDDSQPVIKDAVSLILIIVFVPLVLKIKLNLMSVAVYLRVTQSICNSFS